MQALLAGRTLVDAARQAGDSGWRWFCADWRGASAAAPAAPAQLDEAAKAQARARAEQVQAELIRRSIEAMRAPILASPPSPPPERRSAPKAVILRQPAPVSIGAATGTGWAHTAVARFVAGQPLSHFTLTRAAAELGLSLSDLKAQRAATTQGAAA